jgi:hypothetical protein
MRSKDWGKFTIFVIIGFFLPRFMLFYTICGLLDFKRSNRISTEDLKRYFLGNGMLTWALSPLNLAMDLISDINKGIFKLDDLPSDYQEEILDLIAIAKTNQDKIIQELDKRMNEKKRGMLFFKWYGKNTASTFTIDDFHNEYKYINTIGVSVFNKNQSTSTHYGPIRATYRVLYNLVPQQNDRIYIKVADQTHYWHDDPLFIFDDTLVHQSVNGSEQLRYVMFIDIIRPSKNSSAILKGVISAVRFLMMSSNKIFYKNWDMLK